MQNKNEEKFELDATQTANLEATNCGVWLNDHTVAQDYVNI